MTRDATSRRLASLLLCIAFGVLLIGCASAPPPPDNTGATLKRYDNVRGQRYTELFLIGGNPITKDVKGGVYNTIGLNSPSGGGDSSPQALLDQIDVKALKKQYDLLAAFKNGPRLWTLDWLVFGEARETTLVPGDDPVRGRAVTLCLARYDSPSVQLDAKLRRYLESFKTAVVRIEGRADANEGGAGGLLH